MPNKSSRELMDTEIHRGVDVRKVKNALDIKQAITSYYLTFLSYCGMLLAGTILRPLERAKVETPPNHWTVSVLRRNFQNKNQWTFSHEAMPSSCIGGSFSRSKHVGTESSAM